MTSKTTVAPPASAEAWPPEDRPIVGLDVHEFLQRFHLDINLMEAVFAIPSRRAWYDLVTKKPDEPLAIPKAVLIRFFAVYPGLLPFYSTESAEDLREDLNLSPAAFGLLVGRQEISVRQWSEEREPHKVVAHLLWLVRKSLNLMDGSDPVFNGEEMLADLVRFSFLEWSLRGDTPSQRRTDAEATNKALFAEVLSLVPQGSLPRATRGFDLEGQIQIPSKNQKTGAEGTVSATERHIATRSVRERRTAERTLNTMGGSFKL